MHYAHRALFCSWYVVGGTRNAYNRRVAVVYSHYMRIFLKCPIGGMKFVRIDLFGILVCINLALYFGM